MLPRELNASPRRSQIRGGERGAALAAFVITIAAGSSALAQEPLATSVEIPRTETSVTPPPEPIRPEKQSFVWKEKWGRAHPLEYASAVTFGAGVLAAGAIPVTERGWGGNSFDNAMRDGLRLGDSGSRSTARDVSDGLFYGLMAYPIVVDTLLVAGPRNGDVAWQMFVINMHSLAISGFTSVTLERTTGRTRPYVRQCKEDPTDAEDCDSESDERFQSFISGHTLMAFTGAGLVCAHHSQLPLYGGGIPDIMACGVAVTGAAVQGVLRVSSDRHYFTDVAVGGTLGFASGYALPMLLHYGRGGDDAASSPLAMNFVGPYTNGPEVGLQAAGTF